MKSEKIHFRTANINDLHLLESWDQLEHVIAADPEGDWNWEKELTRDPEWREQLIALHGKVPIGFVQIIDPQLEESNYWGAIEPDLRAIDIWIGPPEYLNRGFGTEMMKQTIERCFGDKSVQGILVDPLANNTGTHRFYERLGFKRQEKRTFDGDECYVYRLNRTEYFLS